MVEDGDSPTVEEGPLRTAKKAAVLKLQGQQRKETTPEEVGHISEDEGMAAEEGLVSNATGAINGGTDPLNVQKLNRQVKGELLWHSVKKLKHNHGRWKTWRKREKR